MAFNPADVASVCASPNVTSSLKEQCGTNVDAAMSAYSAVCGGQDSTGEPLETPIHLFSLNEVVPSSSSSSGSGKFMSHFALDEVVTVVSVIPIATVQVVHPASGAAYTLPLETTPSDKRAGSPVTDTGSSQLLPTAEVVPTLASGNSSASDVETYYGVIGITAEGVETNKLTTQHSGTSSSSGMAATPTGQLVPLALVIGAGVMIAL